MLARSTLLLARRSVSVARSAVPVVQTRGYADDGPATAISLTFTTPHLVSSKADLIFLLILPPDCPMWEWLTPVLPIRALCLCYWPYGTCMHVAGVPTCPSTARRSDCILEGETTGTRKI